MDKFDDYWVRLCRVNRKLETANPSQSYLRLSVASFQREIRKAYTAGRVEAMRDATSTMDGGDVVDFLRGCFEKGGDG